MGDSAQEAILKQMEEIETKSENPAKTAVAENIPSPLIQDQESTDDRGTDGKDAVSGNHVSNDEPVSAPKVLPESEAVNGSVQEIEMLDASALDSVPCTAGKSDPEVRRDKKSSLTAEDDQSTKLPSVDESESTTEQGKDVLGEVGDEPEKKAAEFVASNDPNVTWGDKLERVSPEHEDDSGDSGTKALEDELASLSAEGFQGLDWDDMRIVDEYDAEKARKREEYWERRRARKTTDSAKQRRRPISPSLPKSPSTKPKGVQSQTKPVATKAKAADGQNSGVKPLEEVKIKIAEIASEKLPSPIKKKSLVKAQPVGDKNQKPKVVKKQPESVAIDGKIEQKKLEEVKISVIEAAEMVVPKKEKSNTKPQVKEKAEMKSPVKEKAELKPPVKEKAELKPPVKEKAELKPPVKEKVEMKPPVKDKAEMKSPVKVKAEIKPPPAKKPPSSVEKVSSKSSEKKESWEGKKSEDLAPTKEKPSGAPTEKRGDSRPSVNQDAKEPKKKSWGPEKEKADSLQPRRSQPLPQIAAYVSSLLGLEYDVKKYTCFYCNPCHSFVTTTAQWEEHLITAKHRKNVCRWRECLELRSECKSDETAQKQKNVDKYGELLIGADQAVEVWDGKGRPRCWVCILCTAVCNSVEMLLAHLTSILHIDNALEFVNPNLYRPPGKDDKVTNYVRQLEPETERKVLEEAKSLMERRGRGKMKVQKGESFLEWRDEQPEAEDLEESLVMDRMAQLFSDAEPLSNEYPFKYKIIPSTRSIANSDYSLMTVDSSNTMTGMQYMLEIWAPSRRVTPVYYCILCDYLVTNWLVHCTILKHCAAYLKKHYHSVYQCVLLESSSEEEFRRVLALAREKVLLLEGRQARLCHVVQILAEPSDVFVAINGRIAKIIVEKDKLEIPSPPRAKKRSKSMFETGEGVSSKKQKTDGEQKPSRKSPGSISSVQKKKKPASALEKQASVKGEHGAPLKQIAVASPFDSKLGDKPPQKKMTKSPAGSGKAKNGEKPPGQGNIRKGQQAKKSEGGDRKERPSHSPREHRRPRSKSREKSRSPRHHRHSHHHEHREERERRHQVELKRGRVSDGQRERRMGRSEERCPRPLMATSVRPPDMRDAARIGRAYPRRETRLSAQDLFKLETMLRAVGVDLGRPLTMADVEMLRGRVGSVTIDSLLADISRNRPWQPSRP